ncbi:hypothetical protein [Streptomyces sp. TLI_105]|uniref:hypothetical protein n=1 Tax=Streptomyces sp. TLI_105 TaxID=1881019 RepID=UPI0015A6FBEA|nr:hypothetical protein [Streptomyces sp. TLI_105]
MAAAARTMKDILAAAGATDPVTIERYAHLVGGCRTASRPEDDVVDASLRTFPCPTRW